MGYNFQVSTAYYCNAISSAGQLYLGVQISNTGTAPFYYPWPVLIGVKQNGKVIRTWPAGWDITTIPAGGTAAFKATINNTGLTGGVYTISIEVLQPYSPGGVPLLFANAGQNTNGWLDLGTFTNL
jgi:hypothetical protein